MEMIMVVVFYLLTALTYSPESPVLASLWWIILNLHCRWIQMAQVRDPFGKLHKLMEMGGLPDGIFQEARQDLHREWAIGWDRNN